MTKFDFYFWEPCVSPHKSELFNELAKCEQVNSMIYVASENIPKSRLAMGWALREPLAGKLIVDPSKNDVEDIVKSSSQSSIHIFSGIHWVDCITNGLDAAVRHEKIFGIMSEPRNYHGLTGALRILHSWATEGTIRRHSKFNLAIGAKGVRWFKIAGYDPARIFPFAYFVFGEYRRASVDAVKPRVGFLGRLTKAKGILEFIQAMKILKGDVDAQVAGGGENAAEVKSAEEQKILKYSGVLQMSETAKFLSTLDVLVVPSLTMDDGWGAVVSEALLQGVAVVASDKVGASICLRGGTRGLVLTNPKAETIAKSIKQLIDNGSLSADKREFRAQWAKNHLAPVAGARKLIEISQYVRSNLSGRRPGAFFED